MAAQAPRIAARTLAKGSDEAYAAYIERAAGSSAPVPERQHDVSAKAGAGMSPEVRGMRIGPRPPHRNMNSVRATPEPAAGNGAAEAAELSTGELFAILWQALADILGTAATATLLRRALRGAAPCWPELAELSIKRENFEYCYSVPAAWKHASDSSPGALSALASELCKLLVDLTGSVVVNRLERIPELVNRGVVTPRREPS